jgi:hypothetical protein
LNIPAQGLLAGVSMTLLHAWWINPLKELFILFSIESGERKRTPVSIVAPLCLHLELYNIEGVKYEYNNI